MHFVFSEFRVEKAGQATQLLPTAMKFGLH
jgi:hypothetical protein